MTLFSKCKNKVLPKKHWAFYFIGVGNFYSSWLVNVSVYYSTLSISTLHPLVFVINIFCNFQQHEFNFYKIFNTQTALQNQF